MPERFVRALRIECAPHGIKPSLLLRRGRGRRGRRLLLQREMKPLMTAILLGMAAIDAIQLGVSGFLCVRRFLIRILT